MDPNIFKQIVSALVVASGLPYFAAMIIFQTTVLVITMIILAKLGAPGIAYKIVGGAVFYGLGLAVVSTFGGWLLFILECVVAIPILGILNGFAFTSPQVDAFSIDGLGQEHRISARQAYFGPGENAPQLRDMGESVGKVVEEIAGYKHHELRG